jgi:serine/threonine protein phosphatase PrpC
VERHGDRTLVVVVDGAGGVAGGAAAAELVCAEVEQACQAKISDWVACLEDVDRHLAGRGQAAAVVAVIGDDGTVRGASVGDCQAWMFDGALARELTAAQVRKPLLGEGPAVPVGFEGRLEGVLLVATDGLWKYVRRERVAEVVGALLIKEAAEALVDDVRLKSGALQDDVALAIVECR